MFQIPYETRLKECGSKHLALYLSLRDGISSGLLQPGARLPSTRQLAELYHLSRGSVSLAYEMLAAEGYVRTGIGQGTFVAGRQGQSSLTGSEERKAQPEQSESGPPKPALSAWGRRVTQGTGRSGAAASKAAKAVSGNEGVSFVPRGIGEKGFPWMEWKSAVSAQWRKLGSIADNGWTTEGSDRLRRVIADRLGRERGIRCSSDDIVITGGSMQAIAILSQLLLEEGRTAVVENPGYHGIRSAVYATGAALHPAEVDEEGIIPQDWDAQLLFVTPTRQFPTGAVLRLERRLELLQWAARRGTWIVEDDYDSDFRWGGRPIEPLKSLDKEGRVVYVGSFSRTMRSEVRIGYAVLPEALRACFIQAKRLYDPYPEGIAEQNALADWIADGGYDRHLRRMRRVFHKLQERLRLGLGERLAELFEIVPSDAGLTLFAYWRGNEESYKLLQEKSKQLGAVWQDGKKYAMADGKRRPSALFGFAHLDEKEIDLGIARIGAAAGELGLIPHNDQGGSNHA
ncbi:PLP-dependent aminotransferase family protein [Cohnella sp. AR92]|uniref:MocR-like pyridoxine biosynthesis transcription factor PdxR n=1 Tax=Cohnella sp. AR92 TaxID=648716 RepID=UPI000F8C79A8|nr:PLP-dependent aminotransferase family protein [Cohnella sp. AR92]RUS44656.1 PLP-dependent aminotransferase family protein [Cohnella sp. AR92]